MGAVPVRLQSTETKESLASTATTAEGKEQLEQQVDNE